MGDESSDGICATTWVDRIAVVTVKGTLDLLTSPQLADALDAALAENPTTVVVDLLGVDFLASAGMGVLVAAHDKLNGSTRLGVVASGAVTSRPMRLVGIDKIVPMFETLDEAIRSLSE